MKIKSLFVTLSLFLTVTLSAQETRYEIKSATIKNTIEAMGQKFSATIHFDDYGKKESATIVMVIQGMADTIRLHNIKIGDTTITMDLGKKIGKMELIKADDKQINFLNITPEATEKHKLKEIGEEDILGKNCKKYSYETMIDGQTSSTTSWIWKGISLKSVSSINGMEMSYITTEIQEDATIDPEMFIVPADVNIQNM